MTRHIRRGSIWWANLNPGNGTTPGKTRPVLIMQNQALLDAGHPSTVIIPLTTNIIDDAAPLRLRVPAQGVLEKDSDLLIDQIRADQIRAIDNRRLVRGPILQLDDDFMDLVNNALGEVLGMI